MRLLDERQRPLQAVKTASSLTIRILYEAVKPVERPHFAVDIARGDGVHCYGTNTRLDRHDWGVVEGAGHIDLVIPRLWLLPGCYSVSVGILDATCARAHDVRFHAYPFSVVSDTSRARARAPAARVARAAAVARGIAFHQRQRTGVCPVIAKDVVLAPGVVIHQPDLVNLYGCRVGEGSRIGAFVEVQRGAVIGRQCKISSHSFICDGVEIEDGVFIGHGVMFINDRLSARADAGRPPPDRRRLDDGADADRGGRVHRQQRDGHRASLWAKAPSSAPAPSSRGTCRPTRSWPVCPRVVGDVLSPPPLPTTAAAAA